MHGAYTKVTFDVDHAPRRREDQKAATLCKTRAQSGTEISVSKCLLRVCTRPARCVLLRLSALLTSCRSSSAASLDIAPRGSLSHVCARGSAAALYPTPETARQGGVWYGMAVTPLALQDFSSSI
eukprot:1065203-Pleurochrysis_carterae.AAC.1